MADQDRSTQPTPERERQDAGEPSIASRATAAAAAFVHAATRDGTIPAMGREAIKDVRSTLMEVFFSHPDHGREPGAPLNPTQGEVAAERRDELPSPADIAHDRGVHGPEAERGNVHGPALEATPLPSPSDIAHDRGGGQVLEQETWQERIQREREKGTQGGEDGYDRQKERIKPEEEQKEERDQERERGGRGGRC